MHQLVQVEKGNPLKQQVVERWSVWNARVFEENKWMCDVGEEKKVKDRQIDTHALTGMEKQNPIKKVVLYYVCVCVRKCFVMRLSRGK